MEYALGQPGVVRVIGECVPENLRSVRALERAGMVQRPDLDADLPVWAVEPGWHAGVTT